MPPRLVRRVPDGKNHRATVNGTALRQRAIHAMCTSSVPIDASVRCGPAHFEEHGASVLYFFLPFASALSKFSASLNFTILSIRSNGIGLSNGNFAVALPAA
jgi:hypothetical protein